MKHNLCRFSLKKLSPEQRNTILNDAGVERLMRKYNFINSVYNSKKKEWYQTAYMMILRTMDAGANKEVYFRLGEQIPFIWILRELQSITSIEALLLGGAGLLDICPDDDYINKLREQWQHLSKKYRLSSLHHSEWHFTKIRPINHPVLRLAQVAMLLHNREFLIDQILECQTVDDIVELFETEASEYWHSHFLVKKNLASIPKRLGREKSLLLGINLVVPLQFAYSFFIGQQHMRQRAFNILDAIPAENNRYIRAWKLQGVMPINAFESQAIIQIATEYCQKGRCEECFVTKNM